MTAQTILHDLTARGIVLTATGDQLDVDGPDDALTDELLATLRDHKAELLDILDRPKTEPHDGAGENVEMRDSALLADEPADVCCPICGGAVQEQRGKHFRHLWCPAPGHFDAWRADAGMKLSATDAPIVRGRGQVN